jgi:dolichol-phosphate mannosyltransferase
MDTPLKVSRVARVERADQLLEHRRSSGVSNAVADEGDGERLDAARAPEIPVELAVVIPTYNERGNVRPMLSALAKALTDIEWEVIFVDDHSADGTADAVREVAQTNRRVRVLERIGRRGLASACIEGMLATAAPYVAILDADLQHDEKLLPRMLERIKAEKLDIVIASRALRDGNAGEFPKHRIRLSRLGTRISRFVCRYEVTDAMSGFFLVDAAFFRRVAPRLSGTGFKILVDLLATSREPIRIGEEPYEFRKRHWGESKLDTRVEAEYLYLLLDKTLGRVLPTRFALFALVGSIGLIFHLGILTLLYHRTKIGFVESQATATFFAMTLNFLLNNVLTFRDKRLRGWHILTGLLTFYAACALGALINLSVADSLFRSHVIWWFAAICGVAVSSVWNYGVNTVFTWRREKEPS